MKDKIPVCCRCGKVCKREEYSEQIDEEEGGGEYLSDCCGVSIIYYNNIKEIILDKL